MPCLFFFCSKNIVNMRTVISLWSEYEWFEQLGICYVIYYVRRASVVMTQACISVQRRRESSLRRRSPSTRRDFSRAASRRRLHRLRIYAYVIVFASSETFLLFAHVDVLFIYLCFIFKEEGIRDVDIFPLRKLNSLFTSTTINPSIILWS